MRLVYVVDEIGADADKIIRESVKSKLFEKGEMRKLHPLPSVDDMVEQLFTDGCNMLITDFRLGENDPDIQYTGVELVGKTREYREDFPCFLATSYPVEAIHKDIDPKVVFSKSEMKGSKPPKAQNTITFFDRARAELDLWEDLNEKLSRRHAELIEIASKRKLKPKEMDELIKLDSKIESRMNAAFTEPGIIKSLAITSFGEITTKAQELIEKLTDEIANVDKRSDSENI